MSEGDDRVFDLLERLADVVGEDADTLTRAEIRALRQARSRLDAVEAGLRRVREVMTERGKALYGDHDSPGLFERLRQAEQAVEALRRDIGSATPLRDHAEASGQHLSRWAGGLAAVVIVVGTVLTALGLASKLGLL